MEKVYRPESFFASEKVCLKDVFTNLLKFHNDNSIANVENRSEDQQDEISFSTKVDEAKRRSEIALCSINLLNVEGENFNGPSEISDEAKTLQTVKVGESYKSEMKSIYSRHRYHRITYEPDDTEITGGNEKNNIEVGKEYAVAIRVYNPFTFRYKYTLNRKCNTNSCANVKFVQEIIALGSSTLTEIRDCIRCCCDLGICVEVEDPLNYANTEDAKEKYPSGFLFINDVFYNDMRHCNSIDYSEVVRRWAAENDIAPMNVGSMASTRVNDLTVRFGYPYVYQHQGKCEHILVFADAWVLKSKDNLNRSDYPLCKRTHQLQNPLCSICCVECPKWICVDSDRLPQDRMLLCDSCFRHYNYDDEEEKIGSFKIYPYFK